MDRVIRHQGWLWDRALGKPDPEGTYYQAVCGELDELRTLMLERKVMLSGRTLWLGGTDVAKKREADEYGKTHYVAVDTFNPEAKDEKSGGDLPF